MIERAGVVTKGGKPLTLLGPEIKAGQKAPDFKLIDTSWNVVDLPQSKGKVRLLSVVHSLDTPVCNLQTEEFEEQAGKFKNLAVYTISMDLPFAQARYIKEHKIKLVKTLSDYNDAAFGMAYGVLIKEQRLLSRAIFIIDEKDIVRYVEYVKEVGTPPDYDKAIEALKAVLNKT
jgi:thiol peroxidase